jgi:light-regulated signal transduction histidine kinase (bacteriophytochrome)
MNINVDQILLETILETVSNEVQALEAITDENGRVTDFRYLLGYKMAYGQNEELRGKQMLSTFPWKKQNGLFEKFVNVFNTGVPLDTVIQLAENGQQKWFRIKARKIENGLVIIRDDVTISKQTEDRIMQLNLALFRKNRELESLSSELKTFNSIAANHYSESLKQVYTSMEFLVNNDTQNLSDSSKANIRRAQSAVQKLKLLTEDIIEFSKIHSEEQMTEVDLDDILAQVINGLQEKIENENAMIKSDNLPTIRGFSSLLSLLFYHLISNALKFRKDELQPVIEIKHSIELGEEIENSAAVKGLQYDKILIIDNGIGFDPQEGEKIFTMFYRINKKGKHKGSGIGLAICKKIMDLHGGFIASECTPECTTFKCYFPIDKAV